MTLSPRDFLAELHTRIDAHPGVTANAIKIEARRSCCNLEERSMFISPE